MAETFNEIIAKARGFKLKGVKAKGGTAKDLPGKSRVGQGAGRDGDGDGLLNEAARRKGGSNKGAGKVWVLGKDRPLPSSLHGVPFAPWSDAPTTVEGWAKVVGQNAKLKEPALPVLTGAKKLGSGVIIREQDGRVWLTRPTNGFGGYKHTFPKGGVEEGLSPQANAIKEAFEETGLQVRITGFAKDVDRSTSTARYYFAERVGGSPALHGWESEAIILAPPEAMPRLLNAHVDRTLAHDAFGAPKPAPLSDADPWAGLNTTSKPLGAHTGIVPAPKLRFAGGVLSGVKSVHDGLLAAAKKAPAHSGFSIGASAAPKRKATSFASLFDASGWGIKGKIGKAKIPGLKKFTAKGGAAKTRVGQGKGRDGDGDGIFNEGEKKPGGGKAKHKAAAPTKEIATPYGAPVPTAPVPKKIPAEIHGMADKMAKWDAGNGAANAARKAIAQYEALYLKADLAAMKAVQPNYDALKPGVGNSYTKAKAVAHQALVADLEAGKAAAIVAQAPKPVAAAAKAVAAPKGAKPVAPAQAAEAIPVVPAVVGWTKVGGQLGSNPGAQMLDGAGNKVYLKFAKSEAHAANEVAGARLYDLAGHSTLKPILVNASSVPGGNAFSTATHWTDLQKFNLTSPAHVALAHQDFVTHAWLGNWDAIGADFDNLSIIGGKAVMVDTGGTMLFRAQGGPKGAAWGKDVVEWDTLRNTATPGNAPKVFSSMTAADLFASSKKVASIPDDSIRAVVMAHGPGTKAEKMLLAETLIARKQDVIKRANALGLGDVLKDGAVTIPKPEAITKAIAPAVIKPIRAAVPTAAGAAKAVKSTKTVTVKVSDTELDGMITAAGFQHDTSYWAGKSSASPSMQGMIKAAKVGNLKGVEKIAATFTNVNQPGAKFAASLKQKMTGTVDAAEAAIPASAAPEASLAVKTPPALPAPLPDSALSSPANPNKGLLAKHAQVVAVANAYAKGAATAEDALAQLNGVSFGSNTFGVKAGKHLAEVKSSIAQHAGIKAAAQSGTAAVSGAAGAAVKVAAPKPLAAPAAIKKPKEPKVWDVAKDGATLTEPPNFMKWGGGASPGPSSLLHLNEANQKATQEIYALAKQGDVDGIKALKADVFADKGSAAVTGQTAVLSHPSQHVKGYAQQALGEIDTIMNPAKQVRFADVADLNEVAALHKAIPIADVTKAERIGYYAVVGKSDALKAASIGAALNAPGALKSVANGKLTSTTYTKAANDAWDAMSTTQRQAIRSHTGSGSSSMNNSAWTGNESGAVKAMRSGIITHGHYVDPGTLLIRNIGLDQKARDKLLAASGITLMEPGGMSTSLNGAFGAGHNTQLRITVGPNVKAIWAGAALKGGGHISAVGGGEAEMLFPSGSRLFVRGSKMEGGKLVVDVVMLPNDVL